MDDPHDSGQASDQGEDEEPDPPDIEPHAARRLRRPAQGVDTPSQQRVIEQKLHEQRDADKHEEGNGQPDRFTSGELLAKELGPGERDHRLRQIRNDPRADKCQQATANQAGGAQRHDQRG